MSADEGAAARASLDERGGARARIDEILVLVFLGFLTAAGWFYADAPGLEPLHNSRLTLMTLLIVVACLPLLVTASTTQRSPLAFVRAWLPLLLGLLCYENLKHLHANNITLALGIEPLDPIMLRIDEWLFGAALPLRLEALVHPALTAYLQMAYTWFYYLMPVIVLVTFYVRASLEAFLAIRKALIVCLLGGYVCYLVLPVAGPLFLIGDAFSVPLHTHGTLATLVFDTLRYNWDCFPSLHTAVPVLLCLLVWRHVSPALRVVLAFATVSIVFAAIYLRLHYGIDIIAGVLWAWLVHVLAGREVSGWTDTASRVLGGATRSDPFITPAKACFIVTGACALALEQVFEKVLSTIVGATSESAALVLVVYFGGLALGAAAYRFVAPRLRRPLLFYGVMEFLVGLWALGAALMLPALQRASSVMYVALHGASGEIAAKLLCAAIWIGVPTFVMGLSFPAMTHFLRQRYGETRACQAQINTFYGANILGGALAAFAAPYFVFPWLGLDGALVICATLEAAVLLIVWTLSRRIGDTAAHAGDDAPPGRQVARAAAVLVMFAFLSGFVFFGLEVVWVHLAATVIGTSVYAFANILLAVLLGLFLGNRLVWRFTWPDREIDGATYVGLIAASVAVLLLTFALWDDVPRLFLMAGPYVTGFAGGEFVRLAILFVLVAVPTTFIGALLPGLFRTAGFRRAGTVRMVSFVSAANALGCIAGAATAGLWLLPRFGSEHTFKGLVAALAVALGVFAWRSGGPTGRVRIAAAAGAIMALVILPSIAWDYRELTAGYNVYFDVRSVHAGSELRYLHESPAGGVTTVVDNTMKSADGAQRAYRTLLTNGKFQGNDAWETEAQVGFALIPVLHARHREQALVIGLGTGQTANIVHQAGFTRVDIAEISPGIEHAAREFFAHINDRVLERPNVTLHRDDGRHLLLLGKSHYDLITIEISSMWFNGATNLYSADFFALAARRLEPGGVLQQWLQIHHISPREISAVLAAARSAFTHVEFWVYGGQGIIVASDQVLGIEPDMIARAEAAPAIRRLGDGFVTRLLEARVLDDTALDRLVRDAGRRGIAANDDTNRAIEFHSPRYNLSRIDHRRLNRDFLAGYADRNGVIR